MTLNIEKKNEFFKKKKIFSIFFFFFKDAEDTAGPLFFADGLYFKIFFEKILQLIEVWSIWLKITYTGLERVVMEIRGHF